MSPLTLILPLRLATRRGLAGTTVATGRPHFVTVTASPVRAIRSRRARHRALNCPAGMDDGDAFMVIII